MDFKQIVGINWSYLHVDHNGSHVNSLHFRILLFG